MGHHLCVMCFQALSNSKVPLAHPNPDWVGSPSGFRINVAIVQSLVLAWFRIYNTRRPHNHVEHNTKCTIGCFKKLNDSMYWSNGCMKYGLDGCLYELVWRQNKSREKNSIHSMLNYSAFNTNKIVSLVFFHIHTWYCFNSKLLLAIDIHNKSSLIQSHKLFVVQQTKIAF